MLCPLYRRREGLADSVIDQVVSILRCTAARVMVAVPALLLAALFNMSPAPAEASISIPHAGASCAQAAQFPYNSDVVGIARTSDDGGYWMVTNDGYVAACGDAPYLGEQTTLNAPIVGIADTPDGHGYYLVASDGGIFTFGDAQFQGSTGSITLNKPVVGMAVDAATGGYWLVASDGGIFAYNAPFFGSTGSITLNKPMVGMASGATSSGYWLVASDGGIFAYNVPFYGSTGNIVLNAPIVGMEATASGSGYRFVAADGGVFAYGSSGFYGTPVFAAPPAPPLPPPSGGSGGAAPSCSIGLSNYSPPDGYEETATITSNQPNAAVTLTKHYKSVTSSDSGVTDGSGNATINFNISSASIGNNVPVDATAGSAACSTSFTPS
jgi:hypothetical protein